MKPRAAHALARLAALLCCALLLAAPSVAQAEEREGPGEEEVLEAVEALEEAFRQRDPAVREAALAEHRVPHPDVVRAIARGLDDDEERVVRATLEALRYTPHEDALEVLHRTAKRDKDVRQSEELAPVLWRAIGWHGAPSSIERLEKGLFSDRHPDSIRARLLALGNIRHRDSIECLLDLGRKTRSSRLAPYRAELRMSLMRLLGVDRGDTLERWEEHWDAVEDDFEMAEEPPRLPDRYQVRWDRFWGTEYRERRGSRREDRGRDDDA